MSGDTNGIFGIPYGKHHSSLLGQALWFIDQVANAVFGAYGVMLVVNWYTSTQTQATFMLAMVALFFVFLQWNFRGD